MSVFRRLALTAAAATYLLIVLGGIVRTTGSGLGCPDWPLCHGRFLPPLELTAILEYSHRFSAALDSLLIVAVAFHAWFFLRSKPRVVVLATAALGLLVVQIALGAITVRLELPPQIVLVHLAVALLILGILVWLGLYDVQMPSSETLPGRPGFVRLAGLAALLAFALVLTGANVRASGAGWACAGFPLCNGEVLPSGGDRLVDIQILHRFAAYVIVALLAYVVWRAWALRGEAPAIGKAAIAVAVAVAFQFVVGAAAVSAGLPVFLRALHVAGAAAVWASVVALAALAFTLYRRSPQPVELVAAHRTGVTGGLGEAGARAALRGAVQGAAAPMGSPVVWRSLGLGRFPTALLARYLSLTKPTIISLLLVTTLASMMVAAEGLPPLPLVLVTLLGGALSAGAANTFNCYLDRDIDGLMHRTSRRPLPSGAITPRKALVFGLTLALLSMVVLGLFVNWLAAALALSGLLYYVFVYTCWLKRSSPSNIVIGGAAGAVPPLVGWAAVTGEVSLLAVYLFAIIFLWTPPHFWALALLIRREYERARVPMLPTVRGEDETRHQILVYSVCLVAFTLVVVLFRQMGVFYLAAALALGGVFVYQAARLLREASSVAARRLFQYSILYLALLFAAMVIDRWRVV